MPKCLMIDWWWVFIFKIDINFDYDYGFDYDKVIKERLKQANQAFEDEKNDPPKRKSILVSFDNAVTAIELGAETEPDGKRLF